MRNSQLRYAIIYVIITALALCFLNIYAARTSRNLVFRANESAVMERARVIAASFQDLDSVTEEDARQAVLVLGPQSYDRIVITDEAGVAVFDSMMKHVSSKENPNGALSKQAALRWGLRLNDEQYTLNKAWCKEEKDEEAGETGGGDEGGGGEGGAPDAGGGMPPMPGM